MTKFEEVCLLSCENWADSFPSEIPEHTFSKKHIEKIREICCINQEAPKNTKRKLSKKNIKFLLIAAILLLLSITALANPASREFIIKNFSNHSEYVVSDISNEKHVKSLTVKYVPAGFEKTEMPGFTYNYINGDKLFTVIKCELSSNIGYDTEEYDDEIIKINGVDAVYFMPSENYRGIIFNNGEYVFLISGNISKEELVRIAQNVE